MGFDDVDDDDDGRKVIEAPVLPSSVSGIERCKLYIQIISQISAKAKRHVLFVPYANLNLRLGRTIIPT